MSLGGFHVDLQSSRWLSIMTDLDAPWLWWIATIWYQQVPTPRASKTTSYILGYRRNTPPEPKKSKTKHIFRVTPLLGGLQDVFSHPPAPLPGSRQALPVFNGLPFLKVYRGPLADEAFPVAFGVRWGCGFRIRGGDAVASDSSGWRGEARCSDWVRT